MENFYRQNTLLVHALFVIAIVFTPAFVWLHYATKGCNAKLDTMMQNPTVRQWVIECSKTRNLDGCKWDAYKLFGEGAK